MTTNVQAKVFNRQRIRICPHTTVDGEAWKFVARGKATGNGASDGTTIVDTNADSGAANTYNGRYWVRMTSGSYIGQTKRIVDDDGSGTLTIEGVGFDGQIVSGDTYEILLGPDPVIVVDSSSGATNIVDAVRAEDDDYWNGLWVFVVSGSNRGEFAQVTDFVSSTGTFTVGSGLSGALTAGDVCTIGYLIDGTVTPSLSLPYNARLGVRSDFAIGDGVVGERSGTLAIQTHVIPSGTRQTSGGALQLRSHLWPLLQAGGLEASQLSTLTTDDADGACTTTSLRVTNGSADALPIGAVLAHNGNLTVVQQTSAGGANPDTITVSPPLPVAPVTGVVIEVLNLYQKSTSGNVLGCVVEYEVDGHRTLCTGCKGNVTLTDGSLPTFDFAFSVDHWIMDYEPAPHLAASAYSSAAPILSSDRIAYLNTTKVNIGGFTATPGTITARRAVQGNIGVNGGAGFQITGYAARGTYREIMQSGETLSELLQYTARTNRQLFVAYGSGDGYFAVVAKNARRVEAPMPANANGLLDAPAVWEAQDAGYVSVSDGGTDKFPDFLFALN